MYMQPNTNQNIKITRVLFSETIDYNDQFIRPYETQLDLEGLNKVKHYTEGGMSISAASLAPVAGDIIRPSAMVQGQAMIAGGWGQKRLRFMMEVEINLGGAFPVRNVYMGYTDHIGIIVHNGIPAIDPAMMLTFNSSVRLHTTMQTGPLGRQQSVDMRDPIHILAKPQAQEAMNSCSMRPQDLFSSEETSMYTHNDTTPTIDTRTAFTQGAKLSRRSNGLSSDYLARSLAALTTSIKEEESMDSAYETTYSVSRGKVREQDYGSDAFLMLFMGEHSMLFNASIRWGDILAYFPYAADDKVTKVSLKRPGTVDKVPGRGQTEFLQGANMVTVQANHIASSLPGMMLDNMITYVKFTATNSFGGGSYAITPVDANTFSKGIDPRPYVANLMNRIRYELLQTLSRNNQMKFGLEVECDVQGSMVVDISIDGAPSTKYVFATFTDALTPPVIAYNTNSLQAMSNDIANICHNLADMSGV